MNVELDTSQSDIVRAYRLLFREEAGVCFRAGEIALMAKEQRQRNLQIRMKKKHS